MAPSSRSASALASGRTNDSATSARDSVSLMAMTPTVVGNPM
jgi:hypothetical protein